MITGQTMRLEDEPVGKFGFTVYGFASARSCGSDRDAADCGRRHLDIKIKKALGIYKNRYAGVM